MRIAFDIDDTLIIPSVVTGDRDIPNYETIAIYKWFQSQGHTMILWSGSGIDWAKTWGEKLGLKPDAVIMKDKKGCVDICFDDCEVDLATVNVRVKRIDNSISRTEWNATKGKAYKKEDSNKYCQCAYPVVSYLGIQEGDVETKWDELPLCQRCIKRILSNENKTNS